MKKKKATYEELEIRLEECENLIRSFRTGGEHYRLIVDSSDDAIISKDLNGIITSWNKGAERIFGYTEQEILGKSIKTLIPLEQHPDEDGILSKIRRGIRIEHYETVRLRKDGSSVDISLTISPIKDERGEIIGASKVARDISAQKRAMDRIRESEEKFTTIFNESPVGAVLTDAATGRMIDANRAFLDLCGFSLEELKGRIAFEIDMHRDPEEHKRIMEQLGREGFLRDLEVRIYHRSGRPIDTLLNAAVVTIAGERQMLVHVEDITERKNTEVALREADRHKDEFLATLAHELRSPLAPLGNALQLLELATDDPAISAQARSMMSRQLGHIVHLVDDLMDVSRVSRGVVELRKVPVDVRSSLVQAIEATRPMIDQQGHRLELELTAEPLWVEGDSTRLVQIFSNLLNNAAKYTDPGGVITVHSSIKGGQVVVSVGDTGIGIDPRQLEKVFDMFAQLETALTRKHGGLGIGLNIVKNLVEMHGGTIMVHSEGWGRGSLFTVCLPLNVPARTDGPENHVPRDQAERLRILVVDDNVESAVTLSMVLRKMGHDVRAVHSGKDAIVEVPIFKPHMVFMDIGMPHMDGYEACRRIRAGEEGRDVFMAALTGWGQEGDKRLAQEAGFDLHVVKPIGRDSLSNILRTVNGKKILAERGTH
jgi:PAS domain S-box-containing protein